MRPSGEVAVGLIQTLLSRPPRIADMLDAALRDHDIGLETVAQQYGFRLMFMNFRNVKSYEELDQHQLTVFKSEVGEVLKFLPQNYVLFVKTFFELGDLESLCLNSSTTMKTFSLSILSPTYVGQVGKDSRNPSLSGQDFCGSVESLYKEYLSKVRKSLDMISEDSTRVYEVVKSLSALHYYRRVRNTELLGLGADNFENFLGLIKLEPLSEVVLRKAVKSLSQLDKVGLTKYTVHEAVEALKIATDLLAHREGLVNLLALYLVTRYYEFKVARYVFIPKVLRRW